MSDLYKGTSAYKIEEYENYARKTQKKQTERKEMSKMEHKALSRLVISAGMLAFVACSALVYVNVMTLRAATRIDELEKELALITDTNKQKEIEINQKLDMKVIEKKAVEKLGMQKPDNSQIVYINVKKGTHSESLTAAPAKKGLFVGIKKSLKGIVAYFS